MVRHIDRALGQSEPHPVFTLQVNLHHTFECRVYFLCYELHEALVIELLRVAGLKVRKCFLNVTLVGLIVVQSEACHQRSQLPSLLVAKLTRVGILQHLDPRTINRRAVP